MDFGGNQAYDRIGLMSSYSYEEMSSSRRTKHSVDNLVFFSADLFSIFEIVQAGTVSVFVWPFRQRWCSVTIIKSLQKETSKRGFETYMLHSLEAVTESLIWSMTLCSGVFLEGEEQNRIKDVLWEADRVCYKCNIQLQWNGTKDTGHRPAFCETGLATNGTCGFLRSFTQTVYEPMRVLNGRAGQQLQTLGMQPVHWLLNNFDNTASQSLWWVYPNRARQGGTWSGVGLAMLQDPLPSPLREGAAMWPGFRLAVCLKSRTVNNETV